MPNPGQGSAKAKSKRTKAKNRAYVILVLVIVPVLAVGLFVIAPITLSNYDQSHQTTVQCEVETADFGKRSTVNRIGAGSSREEVEITTKDCGKLLLREGVTEENGAEIAATLSAGSRFEFTVGQGSWKARGFFNAIKKYPFAFGYRPASD
jgi:hypothetical protein